MIAFNFKCLFFIAKIWKTEKRKERLVANVILIFSIFFLQIVKTSMKLFNFLKKRMKKAIILI